MAFSLVVLAGDESGRVIDLPPPESLIGSAPVCHIVLSSPTVSRVHCRLATDGLSLAVHDQASTNGTLVNGRLVQGQVDLVHGDVLRVGPFEFRARWVDTQSVVGNEPRAADLSGDTAQLYQRALEHDEEAARQLYYRFLPRITRIAEKSLGTQLKRVVDAEEVAEEVLVEALIEVAAYDFRRQGSFMAFLRHKLRNVICDHSRYWSAQKRSAERTVSLDTGSSEGDSPECADNRMLRPEAILSLDEQLERMRQGLARLSRDERQLIQWAKIEERPYEDIAHELNLSRDAVRMRVNRAVAQLQKVFDGME